MCSIYISNLASVHEKLVRHKLVGNKFPFQLHKSLALADDVLDGALDLLHPVHLQPGQAQLRRELPPRRAPHQAPLKDASGDSHHS